MHDQYAPQITLHPLVRLSFVSYSASGKTQAAGPCAYMCMHSEERGETSREKTRSGHPSQKGRENVPVAGTNRRRGERIYPCYVTRRPLASRRPDIAMYFR
eukprot:413701-Pyramimonas_sp.AAC.3